mmetsp:Transcript_107041/g.149259  ORF Transcript_107041/g.149259 Transcript_107041/m.149259 type:complete len:314 (-) Transcript_107041:12-953(-)
MGFVKVIKTKAYFSRYQVKFRRRREGKTDYQQRKFLITQDKNKYNTPKYRFVVRLSNRTVTCQIIYAKLVGDVVLAAAYSHELPRYGLTVGLNNYAAAYCTGLLLGRRVLQKLGLDSQFEGHTEITGEDFGYHKPSQQEKSRARRRGKPLEKTRNPFVAFLDVGLRRTTTGSKIFACLKGACDAGVAIPHSPKRFAGYDAETGSLDTDLLRSRIFGGHVADYMNHLQEEDPETYKKHFNKYIQAGVEASGLEALYTSVHQAIRADPSFKSSAKDPPAEQKNFGRKRLSYQQRKDRVRQKTQSFQRKMLAAAGQ